MSRDPRERFSSRVEDYVRYRPGYPDAAVDLLERECGLTADSVVADVGSGTGILTRLLLDRGCRVYGVEPNREMREAGEAFLAAYPRFTSVDGSAEETTLGDASVDLVTAGQAFHWFDKPRARAELARILRPGGAIALIWNIRRTDATPFMSAFEALLVEHGTDYESVSHKGVEPGEMDDFFGVGSYRLEIVPNRQVVDYDGLEGRLLSASYVPGRGQPGYEPMLAALRRLFDEHERDGRVTLEYDTKVYYSLG